MVLGGIIVSTFQGFFASKKKQQVIIYQQDPYAVTRQMEKERYERYMHSFDTMPSQ